MNGAPFRCRVLIAGRARGPILRIDEPISFWGGIDPETGRVSDPRASRHGACIGGTILTLRETRGSSSSSAVMLELLARGIGPAAVIMGSADAILGLGVLVAREMGHATIPLLELPPAQQRYLADGATASIAADGTVILGGGPA